MIKYYKYNMRTQIYKKIISFYFIQNASRLFCCHVTPFPQRLPLNVMVYLYPRNHLGAFVEDIPTGKDTEQAPSPTD